MIDSEEKLVNIFEEYCFKDTVGEVESLMMEDDEVEVVVNSIELFKTIKEYVQNEPSTKRWRRRSGQQQHHFQKTVKR